MEYSVESSKPRDNFISKFSRTHVDILKQPLSSGTCFISMFPSDLQEKLGRYTGHAKAGKSPLDP